MRNCAECCRCGEEGELRRMQLIFSSPADALKSSDSFHSHGVLDSSRCPRIHSLISSLPDATHSRSSTLVGSILQVRRKHQCKKGPFDCTISHKPFNSSLLSSACTEKVSQTNQKVSLGAGSGIKKWHSNWRMVDQPTSMLRSPCVTPYSTR
jgi:hypothetical protein